MKKKFENFLKQLGDSPKKKRNISANGFGISEVAEAFRPEGRKAERQFRVFRVMRSRERQRAEKHNTEEFRSRYAEKERATRADRRKARGSERFRHNSLLCELRI